MSYTSSILSVLLVSSLCCSCFARQDVQDDLVQCPPWFFYNTSTKTCECYSNPRTDHIVRCAKKVALLKLGYCMTYEEGTGFHVGHCGSVNVSGLNITNDNYIRLPDNISDLNDYMCGPLNRQGMMCSQCADGFGFAVFSVGHTCTNCTGVWYGIPLYLFIEFVPITVFFFVVLVFRISFTSAPMVAFVFYSQITVTVFTDNTLVSNILILSETGSYDFSTFLVSFYGVWNLDFFRFIVPPFCVSSLIKPIHITFLHFISAFYPLCLITLSWICINLYSRNFKLVVWIWDKLKQNFQNRFNVSWDATSTIIDVFATFFLLSYAKLVFASLRTMYYETSLDANNHSLQQNLHVKSDSSMRFFGKEHLPFAITSLSIFLLVVLPVPFLLALYPIRSVRTLLFKCPIGSHTRTAINLFVQKFCSCYRDSTDGGRDMRSLVSIYFFFRLLLHLVPTDHISANVSLTIFVFMYISCGTLIALAQPYKRAYMNIADTLIFMNIAVITLITLLSQLSGELSHPSAVFSYTSGSVLTSLPLLVLIGTLIYKMIWKILVPKLPCCKRFLHSHQRDGHSATHDGDELISESRDDLELQEFTVNAEECDKEYSSVYIDIS